MAYNTQYDFIVRTKEIIKQYENGQIPKDERYEVTLFLNCLVGLIIIPEQKWYKKLPTEIVSETKWGINANDILISKKNKETDEKKSVRNIARHLRNSIAHFSFDVKKGNTGKIDSVLFEDFTDNTKTVKTFESVLSINSIRKFSERLADFGLSQV